MSRDYRLYLDDMKTSSEKIRRYVGSMSFGEFLADEKTLDAVVRNLQIVGEAAGHVPEEITRKYPLVDWAGITGFRNIVVHEYFGVDEEILWDIITRHVPRLDEQLSDILVAEGTDGGQAA